MLSADGVGPLLPGVEKASEATQRIVDDEVRRIVDTAYDEVLDLLREERGRLDGLAEALLEHETLDSADAYAAAGLPPPVRARDVAAAAAVAAAAVATPTLE